MTENGLAARRDELENAAGDLRELCEDVAVPMQSKQYVTYFCGATAQAIAQRAPRRKTFYAAIERYSAAHAALGQDLADAGYAAREIASIEKETARFQQLRQEICKTSGDAL